MIEDLPKRGGESGCVDLSHPFDDQAPLLDWLYAQSQAGRWKISRQRFAAVLERSAKKALSPGTVTPQKLQEYLNALHLEDLALATACADGSEIAWEHFFATYRAYLRAASAAILRCSAGSAEACDLADSLFTELYGLADGEGSERSLFRYFHGRSSLKTWLRAVLAQRHIDSIRAGRRFEDLAEDESGDGQPKAPLRTQMPPVDPHHDRYIAWFTRALQSALDGLEPHEKHRLRLYYAEEHSRRLDACWASTNPASRGISTACGAICAKPSKTFFARALARRTVPWFNPALAMRRSLSASNIARAKRPSIWINCCRLQDLQAQRPESGRRERPM